MEFYETKMGKKFFKSQLPRLIAALEQIGNALENENPHAILLLQEQKEIFSTNCITARCRLELMQNWTVLKKDGRKSFPL